MKDKVLAFCRATDTPRWMMLLGALATVLMTTLISMHLQNASRIDEHRAENIRVLVDSMTQFQVFASAFASEMVENGNVAQSTKEKLVENLNDQYARLRTIEKIVNPDKVPALKEYRQAIVAMSETVSQTKDVKSMRLFWTKASDLLVARNSLNSQLQKTI